MPGGALLLIPQCAERKHAAKGQSIKYRNGPSLHLQSQVKQEPFRGSNTCPLFSTEEFLN